MFRSLFLLLLFLVAQNVYAMSVVGPAKITYIENGWYGEGIAIHLDKGVAGCNAPDNDFAISAGHPAYKEIVALVTSAFMSSTTVELIVNEGVCIFGDRTSVVSIRLYK